MEKQKTTEAPTPFQQNIIQKIATLLDEDGCCRTTNAALAKVCSDVTRKRLSKEITALVRGGYLKREIDYETGLTHTERRLWLTPKTGEKSWERVSPLANPRLCARSSFYRSET